MLNPILPSISNSGNSLTPADFPDVENISSEDRVLLSINNEFKSSTFAKFLEPLSSRLDELEGDDGGESEVSGVIQKNKLFSYTGRIIGSVGAIELTTEMSKLGINSLQTFAFSISGVSGGISVPVQPIDTVNDVFVNVRSALALKSASNAMTIGLFAGSVIIEALPSNRTVSFANTNPVSIVFGINGKSAKSYTKTEKLSINGQLVGSGNGYSSVANDLPEIFQKMDALERASSRVIIAENLAKDLQVMVSEQAVSISNLNTVSTKNSTAISEIKQDISEYDDVFENLIERIQILEGSILEAGTPRFSSSSALITQGLVSAAPEEI